jgi:hypothetical protein
MTLDEESQRATVMLHGKVVTRVVRHRDREVLIEFSDGSRLFCDSDAPVALSIQSPDC